MLKDFKPVSLILIAGTLCFSGNAYADLAPVKQSTSVTQQAGKVTGTVEDDLGPVAGASVVVKGTTNGNITDMDGNFTLEGVKDGDVIQISFIGYTTQEIKYTGQPSIQIKLAEDAQKLDEVVVTALGIKREKKALGYAMQELKGDALVEARETNVANALSGKVSGLQIVRSSNGPAGSSKIVLRGNTSLTGSNQPLIVVDGIPMDNTTGTTSNDLYNPGVDMGNGLSDINPEDIESMSVLKGASAAALYGSRAGSGVILITTKSGKKSSGLGITISSTVSMETIFMDPKMQNEFGQGTNGIFDNRSESSWGPKIEGQEVENWNGQMVGMRAYDNVKNYFDTGINLNENISFQQQYGKSSIYTSLTRMDDMSKIPGAKLKRTNLMVRAVSKFGKDDKWTTDAKVQYINSDATNRPLSGINQSNAFNTMYMLPRSMDIRDFSATKDDKDKMIWFGGGNQYNPYWLSKYKTNQDIRDRFLMYASLKYEFTDWLNAELRAGSDIYNTDTENKTYGGSPSTPTGRYSYQKESFYENNFSFLIAAQKDNIIDRLGASASLGGNLMMRKKTSLSGDAGELQVPNLFKLNNSKSKPTVGESLSRKKINSLYGTVQINWDGYLFLDATFRNDWSSALSKTNRSFFYPSLSVAYVFSDMMNKIDKPLPEWVTFAKIRGSVAQVGNDMDAYQLYNTYSIGTDPEGNITAGAGNTLFDSSVKSELITSYEAGLEVKFFNNRLGLDFAWYKSNATRQLINLPMDPLSGYASRKINAGDIQNQGIELMLNARPIETASGFNWDLMANFSINKNTVKSLADGVSQYSIMTNPADDLKIYAVAGGDYGEIFGSSFKRVTDNSSPFYGQLIVDENGKPIKETDSKKLGTQQASSLLGITNTFEYKGFSLSFLIDCRFGGKIFSATNRSMQVAGTSSVTVVNGARENMIVNGVYEKGGQYVPNDIPISVQDYYAATAGNGNVGIVESNLYDASNVRLRNLQLNYNFPMKMLSKTPFQRVKLGLSCNNVWMISSHLNGIDPESVFATGSNAVGFENGASPTSRSYLFNITLGF